MSKHKNLKRNLLICLLAGSAVMYTLPLHAATSVIGNNTLPTGGSFVHGNGSITSAGLEMNVIQNGQNAVIKWGSFDVGGSATVNFSSKGAYANNFNTLNYVNSASASQIYGTINAQGGNIFIVNPAGVQIGNSAQINVGSLYVSSNTLNDSALKNFYNNAGKEKFVLGGTRNADIELMSLGNINANKVTFEGNGRIVIDSERLKDVDGTEKLTADKIFINTKDENNLVIGYDGYDENKNNGSYNIASNSKYIATVNGKNFAQNKGYMWVEDVKQLQAIDTNLGGNYALRNSIDGTQANNFKSIGSNTAFTGNFDGIDYNIFGLTIKNGGENTGLFGYTNNATISNVTLVGGSISGSNNVGAIVGSANNTTLTNVVNSAAVSGNSNVGGIVGIATGTTVEDAINTGTIEGNSKSETNVGGLIGEMKDSNTADNYKSQIIGNSYNLGAVTGDGANVGGLVGYAVNSTIGDGTNLVYNRLDVTGAYNVGGIVGNMEGTTVQNAENSGNVTAKKNITEEYHYHAGQKNDDNTISAIVKNETVNVANVGGIAGKADNTDTKESIIKDVTNTGNVSSSKQNGNDYYDAGNVGGIVGSAVDTNISNATNKENEVRGAHNVGGVAGYFGNSSDAKDAPDYTITKGINDGGDIMATGARNGTEFVTEKIRPGDVGAEVTIIGNMGGIVGYLDGDNVHVTSSGNRGTVHSLDITGDTVSQASQASNTGGVVGKIDRSDTLALKDDEGNIIFNVADSAVSNSYNTGDVRGYMGVGGVVGMMYNGEVAGSYNLGSVNTTRRAQDADENNFPSVNMGGVVGDTTEQTNAKALIYDVYNKGQIGDETYQFYARHVGGVVGRLSGTVEKAYNTGAIYNGYNVVGGIAGWFYKGTINNSFNTGNITVVNNEEGTSTTGSQVGGIVGGAGVYSGEDSKISNAYNLGTIRSFKGKGSKDNSIGGIVGGVVTHGGDNKNLIIENVYTTGNLYAGNQDGSSTTDGLGSIYGDAGAGNHLQISNAYYIRPDEKLVDENGNRIFTDLSAQNINKDNSNKAIAFDAKSEITQYQYDKDGKHYSLTFTQQAGGDVDGGGSVIAVIKDGKATTQKIDTAGDWRIYGGNTPILNAFLPNSEKYFERYNTTDDLANAGITSIQYGTAYDPLLTIINANGTKPDLSYNWSDLGINNAAGIAVYGAGLTLKDVNTSSGTGYFGGTIYADGALNLNGSNDIGLGSAAQIYGSAVNITTDGQLTIYGDITATGNTANVNIDEKDAGDISINAGDVDVYGTLTSATNENISIPGIEDEAVKWTPGEVSNPYAAMSDIADRFAHKTNASTVGGNINITATGTKNADGDIIGGNVNLYFGNKEQGLITTGGNLTVTGTGDVYVDSDLDIGGDLTLEGTGADSEVVLDITNIGQVQADNGTVTDALTGLHNFMHHFSDIEGDGKTITLNAEKSGDVKFTADMWDYDKNEFDLDKFDTSNHTFVNELNNIKANINGDDIKLGGIRDYTYIWISDAEQLNGIQKYYDNKAGSGILSYNFALKNDINASDLTDYNVIGTAANGDVIGYSGTFDGRGNRIIGLEVDNESNAGIFSQINQTGVVKDVNIYSGTFTGSDNAGAVAGENNGRIEGIVTFGNTVTVNGKDGKAGGIVGVNNSGEFKDDANDGELTGGIYDVESTGSVIAGSSSAVAGGLVGTNNGGLANSFSDSAVTVATGVTLDKDTTALGGVVGINNGNVQYVDSLGVTNGGATGSSNIGGIIGTNNGNMYSGYNESIVSGNDKVGGIIGENKSGKTVSNVVNATSVTGATKGNDISEYVGGLVGVNSGSVTNGRNNGTIAGTNYVGGLVGDNADEHSILTNLVNDSSAEILGVEYVGGIAGKNRGTITADRENNNLINRGSITGHKYVGGVAGLNVGTITNTNIDVELKVNNAVSGDHQYFGGIVGQNGDDKNEGTIENATNSNKIVAPNASYVGGIVGWNTQKGKLIGMGNSNEGEVIGGSYVGGVIGKNDAAIGSKNAAQVGIKNEGVVIATNGGAGGLIGENNAAITNTIMTNKGEVHGNNSNDGSGTGGLIGTNSGAISYSSMTNEVTGTVTGVYNVGGLIGVNKADITGGRDTVNDKDSGYYLNKIYNNGVINVGNYTDADKDGKYEFAASNGQNIGGLFGTNSGKVEAAYNTGAINASGSTNVGGIAGVNEQGGKLDQVFNTVMTGVDDKGNNVYGTITGGTNVGGLIGNNTGTLSNAYNTTEVSGNAASTGNLVGTNSGTVQYVYGYGVDSIDELIGEVTGTGSISHGHAIGAAENSWFQQDVYEDFTFGANGWKIYDGSTLPMLSVFLTKVTVVDQHLVNQYFSAKHYGELHQITADDIKALIAIGAISAPDGFGAFNNNNGLIQGVADDAMANSGNWLYSQQILGSNINGLFNPNNLGYDISLVYSPFENEDWPNNHWNYLFNDAPFDRNKDFRERKAEVNFVDGGMEI